jgi:hypothetical protein
MYLICEKFQLQIDLKTRKPPSKASPVHSYNKGEGWLSGSRKPTNPMHPTIFGESASSVALL